MPFGNAAPTNEITIEFWQQVSSIRFPQSTLILSPGPDTYTNRINADIPWIDSAVYWDFGNINTMGRLSYTPPVSILGTWQHFALLASQSNRFMAIYRSSVWKRKRPA